MSHVQAARTWIDFRALRQELDFRKVLEHYGVSVKVKGDRATGFCPLPTHVSRHAKRRSASFSVDLPRGIWQCFGCQAKGNVLDFCCRMEGFNPGNPHELREGALRVRDLFRLNGFAPDAREPKVPVRVEPDVRRASDLDPKGYTKILVNPPLDFELQNLDYNHPYLPQRGFNQETIRRFGLGYCNRGMLKHRIAIPLHDSEGTLVGYAGRVVEDKLINDANPKYRFPTDRERAGVLHEFRKSHLLYNAHRITGKVPALVVVEGFASVWWLHANGYPETVALMGADCSLEQAKLVVEKVAIDGSVYIMSDGDPAGEHCAESALRRIAHSRLARWVKLNTDEQPTDLSAHDLEALLTV